MSATFAPVTDTMDTKERIERVFACPGFVHITTGTALLKNGKGYFCPECGDPVTNITATPIGLYWFAIARPDLGGAK